MTRRYRVSTAWLLGLALVGVVQARPAQAALPREVLECGDTVDHSLALANNLTCTDDGLTVAEGVTLDLGGHRIQGDGGVADIGIHAHHTAVVRNGTVSRFGDGVRANGAVRLRNLVVTQNGLGVRVIAAGGSLVKSTVTGNSDGVSLQSVAGARLISNRITGNDDVGILAFGGGGSLIERNEVSGNGGRGMDVGLTAITAPFSIVKNVVSSNGGDGIHVLDGDGVRLVRNKASANRFSGIVLDSTSDAVVKKNKLNANTTDGLFVHPDSLRPRVVKNKANGNGLHGMDVQAAAATADATIVTNVAKRNGFLNGPSPDGDDNGLGIASSDGATGSDNTASGNDDPDQCDPGYLC